MITFSAPARAPHPVTLGPPSNLNLSCKYKRPLFVFDPYDCESRVLKMLIAPFGSRTERTKICPRLLRQFVFVTTCSNFSLGPTLLVMIDGLDEYDSLGCFRSPKKTSTYLKALFTSFILSDGAQPLLSGLEKILMRFRVCHYPLKEIKKTFGCTWRRRWQLCMVIPNLNTPL